MKNFFTKSSHLLIALMVLSLLVSTTLLPVTASAQQLSPAVQAAVAASAQGDAALAGPTGGGTIPPVGGAPSITTQGTNQQTITTGCNILYGFNLGTCLLAGAAKISEIIFTIAGYILFVAGMLLDWSIRASVIFVFSQSTDPSSMFAGFAKGLAGSIQIGWGVLRDVSNIFFIFILLYTGIKLILGQEDHPGTRVKNIIVIAFLVNFSLLFTELIIDASNIIALVFYKVLVPNDATSISSLFLNGLNLNDIFANASLGDNPNNYYHLAIVSYLMGSVAALLAAWVFLSAAITFVIRTGVLLLLMILSPLAFVLYAFPGSYSKKYDEWFSALIENCIVAPIYLFLIWICAFIINAMLKLNTLTGSSSSLSNAFTTANGASRAAGSNAYLVFFTYAIVIFLIWGSLYIAKRLSGVAAETGRSLSGTVAGIALGGIGGFALRQTVGRGVAATADSKGLADFGAGKGKARFVPNIIRTGIVNTTKGVASSSYDVRNSSAGKSIAKSVGMNLGQSKSKGSFSDRVKNAAAVRVKFAEDLGHDKDALGIQENKLVAAEASKQASLVAIGELTGRTLSDEEQEKKAFHEAEFKQQDAVIKDIKKESVTIKTARQNSYANALRSNTVIGRTLFKSHNKASEVIMSKIKLEDREKHLEHKKEDWKKETDNLQRVANDADRDLRVAIKNKDISKIESYTRAKAKAESELKIKKGQTSIEEKALKLEVEKLKKATDLKTKEGGKSGGDGHKETAPKPAEKSGGGGHKADDHH